MKIIVTTLIFVAGVNSFAGTITGAGPGYSKELNTPLSILGDSNRQIGIGTNYGSENSQVYFIRERQSELVFATNDSASEKINIQSMRPEEIQNSAILDSIKKSQVTKQWEVIKAPAVIDLKESLDLKNSRINSLRGLNGFQGLR